MKSAINHSRLTTEQAVGLFRAHTVSGLRALNEQLPRSQRLERREIERLVDDLLFAVRDAPRQRDASPLTKAIWLATSIMRPARRGSHRK